MISAVLTLRHFLRHLVLDKTVFIPGKLTLCMLGDLSRFFCCPQIFFKFFFKILSGIHVPSECQTVWFHIRFDILWRSKQFANVISRQH